MNYELIKVCGMREADNIREVEALGIDMMGFIFWPHSSRCVTERPYYLPTQARRVGVFVDEAPATVLQQASSYRLDLIQLHGHESPTYIQNLRRQAGSALNHSIKIIKAISIGSSSDMEQYKPYEGCADYLLFDTRCTTVGGSGKQFDWSVLSAYHGDTPFLLSGGIGPDDAERVKTFCHPRCIGIDLNSRFETAPGLKDIAKLKTFIETLQR